MGFIKESFSGIYRMRFRWEPWCCSQVGGSESDLSEPLSALCVSEGVPGGVGAALTALGTGGLGGFPAPGTAVFGPRL